MREILFRGKRVDNGEWVEVMLSKSSPEKQAYDCIIDNGYFENDFGMTVFHKENIIPETVGQYTGLTDKNGKRIFEGDILKCHYDELYPDDYCYEEVVWKYNGWCRREENGYDAFDEDGVVKYGEVMGNIHDNPELLGEKPSEAESEE